MVELVALLLILIRGIFEAILSILGISIVSGMMGKVYIVISVICFISFATCCIHAGKLNRRTFNVVVILLAIMLISFVTITYYGGMTSIVKGRFLSYCSASVAAALMGCVLAEKRTTMLIGKWIPIFSILLTFSVLACLLFSSGMTSAHQLYDDSGITYQNASYYGAIAFAINIYYLRNNNKFETFKIFDVLKPLLYIMILPQILIEFLAGGRGGFVLFGVYIIYFILVEYYENKLSGSNLMKIFGAVIFAGITVYLLSHITVSSYGLQRILNFLNRNSNSNDRLALYRNAIAAFSESPIIGYGLFGVFYKIGFYSHNIFLDVLCDSGVIGLAFIIYVLIKYLKKQVRCIKKDSRLEFIFIVFIYGFVMSLVSNYYLCIHMLFFAIAFIYVYDEDFGEDVYE